LPSKIKRRFRVSLTGSHPDPPIAPHRLGDAIMPLRRAAVWVADITDVDTMKAGCMWPAFWTGRHGAALAGP